VSRALAAAVALALVAASLTVAPGPAPLSGNDRASAAECSWQRHSKRIVRHVKRDGRARRLVRLKHWWTCNPPALPATITAPLVPAATPAPEPQPTPQPEPTSNRLSVKADEYSFTLSRPGVAPGDVVVELNNQGEDPHNLNLRREGGEEEPLAVSEAGPLEHRTARFALSAGTWRLWCSLPEHDERGMNATLVVEGGQPSRFGWPIEPTSEMSRRKGRPAVQSSTARALRAGPGIWLMW
jgi:plastocyanin